jgi:hypothetical protein
MKRRPAVRLILALALAALLVAIVATVVAACGSSDQFAGTWVDAASPDQAMIIEKNGDGSYTVKDPDGKNSWKGTASGDTLSGNLDYDAGGAKPVTVDVSVVVNGDTGKFTMAYNGKSQSLDIKRK